MKIAPGSSMKRLYFLGIGGTLMGSLAQLASEMGFAVSGSDSGIYPPMSDQLAAANIEVFEGFDPAHTTTVVAEASTVYASASTLYVAATRWVQPDAQRSVMADEWSTALHAFDLGGDGAATHLAAGEVPGSTLNQFSLSEFDGHLRIATTWVHPVVVGSSSHGGMTVNHHNTSTAHGESFPVCGTRRMVATRACRYYVHCRPTLPS